MKSLIFLIPPLILGLTLNAQANRTDMLEGLERGRREQMQQQQNNQTAVLKSAARLFGEKDDLTSVITVLPKETRVTILDSDSAYYRVQFEDTEGYILKRQVAPDDKPVIAAARSNEQEIQPAGGSRPVQQNNISRFAYLENKYGTNTAAQINAGKIWKGMDGEMIRDSWGNPAKISRVISSNTVKEEWTYRNTVLYLQNNRLVDWGPVK